MISIFNTLLPLPDSNSTLLVPASKTTSKATVTLLASNNTASGVAVKVTVSIALKLALTSVPEATPSQVIRVSVKVSVLCVVTVLALKILIPKPPSTEPVSPVAKPKLKLSLPLEPINVSLPPLPFWLVNCSPASRLKLIPLSTVLLGTSPAVKPSMSKISELLPATVKLLRPLNISLAVS